MGRTEVVTASTDSSLRLWDAGGDGGAHPSCVRVYSGHTNERNFVGMSVDEQFIACGSESNAAYVYYKPIHTPSIVHTFPQVGSACTAKAHPHPLSIMHTLPKPHSHTLPNPQTLCPPPPRSQMSSEGVGKHMDASG